MHLFWYDFLLFLQHSVSQGRVILGLSVNYVMQLTQIWGANYVICDVIK